MLDLKLTVAELDRTSWIITGYLLGYVAAMPFIGRLSDVWGHRNAFIGSLLLFMLGSVGVALATDINWLIGLRVFQALGAGRARANRNRNRGRPVPVGTTGRAVRICGRVGRGGRRGRAAVGRHNHQVSGMAVGILAEHPAVRGNHRADAVAAAEKRAPSGESGLHRRRAHHHKPCNADIGAGANRRTRRADVAMVRAGGRVACAVRSAATNCAGTAAATRDVPHKGIRGGEPVAPARRRRADNRHGNSAADGEHAAGRKHR